VTLPAGAPPALMQVAQQFAQTSRGIVAFRLRRTFDVRGGLSSRHEDLMMNAVYDDGSIVKVRVASYTINGRAAGAADVASVERSWDHPKAGDVFAAPFDARNFGAYQYQNGGPSTVDFTSSERDPGHGNGSFTYDAQGDVLSCTYQPNALPPHARWGEITDRRGEVLPGYWAVTEETQEYRGTYGPFAAAGTVEFTFSDFRRFADLASALGTL
jgi:hypothetical protein